MSEALPPADRPWSIERHGIDPIPESDRHGTASELFWVWFAANIGILGVVYGGILRAVGLNLWQSALVALAGSAGSFVLVGILSVPGRGLGVPQLVLSQVSFGRQGNLGPLLLSWINLLGWEIISVATATYAMLSLLSLAGLPATTAVTILSLTSITVLVILFGLLGHATLVWVQRAATWIFGALTLVIAVMLVARTDWSRVVHAHPGPWGTGVLAALSIIFAGTGISWVTTGADYSRYLPRRVAGKHIILATTIGATVPLFVLIMVGMLLADRVSTLASSANPIALIQASLPPAMAVPYLITAIGGLVAAADLAVYSSGLNLLVLGVRTERHKTVLIDGVIMIAGTIYSVLINGNLIGSLVSFLQILAAGLAAWAGICLVDAVRQKTVWRPLGEAAGWIVPGSVVRWSALAAWVAGVVVALLFTASPWFRGPLARGVFAQSDAGYLLGLLTSIILYGLLFQVRPPALAPRREDAGGVEMQV